jgi:hypothetical protein
MKLEAPMISILLKIQEAQESILKKSDKEKSYFFEILEKANQKYAHRQNNQISARKLIQLSK